MVEEVSELMQTPVGTAVISIMLPMHCVLEKMDDMRYPSEPKPEGAFVGAIVGFKRSSVDRLRIEASSSSMATPLLSAPMNGGGLGSDLLDPAAANPATAI